MKISAVETLLPLARRLPPALAWRYHALPIGEERGRITVAMANPEDVQAQETIMTILGSPICVVQADIQAIDHALVDLWSELSPRRLRVLNWAPTELSVEVEAYAQAIAAHIRACCEVFQTGERGQRALRDLAVEADRGNYNLVIFNIQDLTLMQRLLMGQPEYSLMEQTEASLLIARQPRWPLKKILLVVRGGGTEDQAAIDWTVNIAQKSDTTVTILPILPLVPRMYDGATTMQHDLPALLSADTRLGRGLCQLARRLVDRGIEGTLRLRNELPYWQICNEVSEGDCDLVVIASEPHNWLVRWLKGELINDLMCWADRPVLIAKPIVEHEEQKN